MVTIDPQSIPTPKLHGYLLGAIAPRPIAFASTISADGAVNLSPFSFFNVFGANPPTLIFSPARRVRDNTTKHTLENVQQVAEVVINIVDYRMVEQMSLASTEYGEGVNEFTKAGLTQAPATKVAPPLVAEAPAAFECIVKQVVPTGEEGGAGNLIICEVVMVHMQERILDENGAIDPVKLDAVARMGGDWYCRANGDALFKLPKPNRDLGMGFDQLPERVRQSNVLTGNNLARLANEHQMPSPEEVEAYRLTEEAQELYRRFQHHAESFEDHTHLKAQEYLKAGKVVEAWKVLLLPNSPQ